MPRFVDSLALRGYDTKDRNQRKETSDDHALRAGNGEVTGMGALIVLAVFLFVAFWALPRGYDGMAARMGINWARGFTVAGFFLGGVPWLFFVLFIPDGIAARRNARAAAQNSEQEKISAT